MRQNWNSPHPLEKVSEKGRDGQSEERIVETPAGTMRYTLTRKRVKNLNLRVGADGKVAVSVPLRCPAERADRMVQERSLWLVRCLSRQRSEQIQPLPPVSAKECAERLKEALLRVHPLVIPYGVEMPRLKLRALKSQWGNCHWAQGYITLNTALSRCPEELRDYVALHELVHFLHHNHGPGFYQVMDTLMPDWKQRRKKLRGYSGALNL